VADKHDLNDQNASNLAQREFTQKISFLFAKSAKVYFFSHKNSKKFLLFFPLFFVQKRPKSNKSQIPFKIFASAKSAKLKLQMLRFPRWM